MDVTRYRPARLLALSLFLTSIATVLLFTVVFNLGCRGSAPGAGPVKLMFTGDVGGRLDPCG